MKSSISNPNSSAPKNVVRLFMNGRSQAVRLPAAYRFEGQEVYIEKVGDQVILSPCRPQWAEYFNHAERPSEDFMREREMVFTPRADFE